MGMKVFITGACGYLGSVLVSQLADHPEIEQITGVDIAAASTSPPSEKVKFLEIDIRSPELAEAMAGHDAVIHTAFIVLWPKKMPEAVRDDINLNGTRNVAEGAIQDQIPKFIHASSIAAYDSAYAQESEPLGENCPIGKGDSPFYYANSKALTEKMLTELLTPTDMVLTMLRMPYILGPNNRVTVPEFQKNAVLFPGRNPRTQFIHEDDVVQAFAQALRTPMPGTFNVVPDDTIRSRELYDLIGAKPMTVPFWLAYLITSIRWNFLGSATHPSWLRAMLDDLCFSNTKLKGTGWAPHYTSADAVRSALGEDRD